MKRCLLLCPIGIGNYLLAYPAFHLLKTNYPQVEFYLVALREAIFSLAQNDPIFSDVLVMDPSQHKSIWKKISFIQKIRKAKCDTAASFFPSNRFEYNAFMFASGAGKRYAFEYARKKISSASFLSNRLVKVMNDLHDVLQNIRMAENFGIEKTEPTTFPELFTSKDMEFVAEWLQKRNLQSSNFLGIHAGSSAAHSMIYKRWPEESFIALARQIFEEYGYTALVFGGAEETLIKKRIAEELGGKSCFVEGLNLKQTAALIARCSLFVSNDSGLMHIAALSDVPTVGIFGPTDDIRTAPWGDKHLVIRKKMDCCPCWKIKNVGKREACVYGDFRCLRQLSADEVFDRIKNWHRIVPSNLQ